MPYTMRKVGNEYCVFNKDTGEKKGCSDTRAKAAAHMRALYAATSGVEMGKKDFNGWVFEHQIDQKDAEYNPLGGTSTQACANCEFFDSPNGCLVVRGAISPTGLSRFWEPIQEYIPEPMPVEVSNWPDSIAASPGQSGADPGLIEVARKWWNSLFRTPSPVEEGVKGLRPITLTRDADGRTRAHLIVSNNFEDRHEQIIPEAVHQQAIDFLERARLHPEFQIWHMGTKSRWGEADLVTRTGNFTVFHGLVDPGKEGLAEALANDKNTGVSNGYYAAYTPDRKEFLAWYPYEASALPVSHTANVWSCNPEVLESEGLFVKPEHKAFLTGKGVPENFLDEMEKDIIAQGQRVAAAGVGSKATDGETPPAPTGLDANTTMLINAVGTAIGSAVKPIYERLDAIEQGQKSLEQKTSKTQDEIVADQIIARVGAGQGFKATESPANIIDPNHIDDVIPTSPQQDWLGSELDRVLASNGVAIPSQNGGSN